MYFLSCIWLRAGGALDCESQAQAINPDVELIVIQLGDSSLKS